MRGGQSVTNSPKETNQPSSFSPARERQQQVPSAGWELGGRGRKRISVAPHLPGWLRIPGEVLEVAKGAGSALHVLGPWAIVTPWLPAVATSLGERSCFSTKSPRHRSWTGSQSWWRAGRAGGHHGAKVAGGSRVASDRGPLLCLTLYHFAGRG